jgi:signal peptidase II
LRIRPKDYAVLFLIAGAVAGLDQLTKHLVRANLPKGQVFHPELWLTQYARIVHWHNTGMAGGLFPNMNPVFVVIGLIIAGAILYYYPRLPGDERLPHMAFGLILGGALGNLIDRLSRGYVTDFISIGSLPVLNIADASVAIGSALLVFGVWKHEVKEKQRSENSKPTQTDAAGKPANTPPPTPEETQRE